MKKLILPYKLTQLELKSKETEFASFQDFNRVINESCEAKDKTGKPIFVFIKNYINKNILYNAYKSMEKAATSTTNRGAASGGVRHVGTLKSGKASKVNYVYKIGETSFTDDNKLKVRSGIAGYFDRSGHYDYCRTTKFNKENIEKFNDAIPLIESVDQGFKDLVPERYKKQKQMVLATHPNYRITNTAFTTITINKNWQTAYHYDDGDYKKGFGNLVAYCKNIEPMYLVLPRYGVGINLKSTDLLLLDVHELHGNTEYKPLNENAVRLSFVMYYRQNMWKCGSPTEELQRHRLNLRKVYQKQAGII